MTSLASDFGDSPYNARLYMYSCFVLWKEQLARREDAMARSVIHFGVIKTSKEWPRHVKEFISRFERQRQGNSLHDVFFQLFLVTNHGVRGYPGRHLT